MSNAEDVTNSSGHQSPVVILRGQYDVLTKLYQVTAAQNNILRLSLRELKDINTYQLSVRLENINMPFFAMVGLMVKITLASIPAILLITVIYIILGIILFVLGISYLSLPTF